MNPVIERKISIYETRDYDLFHLIVGNRPVLDHHVSIIKQCMKLRGNLMDVFPAVVSKQNKKGGGIVYAVHDGQHRIEAARQLGMSVFFVIVDRKRVPLQAVREVATSTKKWTYRDYLHSYTSQGFAEYLKIKEYLEIYTIPILTALQLLSGMDAAKWRLDYKAGLYSIRQWDYACMVGDMVQDFAAYYSFATHVQFIQALSMVCRNPEYDHERMIRKLKQAPHLIDRLGSTDQYFEGLNQLYNYNQSAKHITCLRQIDSIGRVQIAGRWVSDEQA